MNLSDLQPWESLMKQLVWTQLGSISGKRILDFGSGLGVTADHFAPENDVIAIEPDSHAIAHRWQDHPYLQLQGSTELLSKLPDESFDVILCHNVLEYAAHRETIIREFARLLKPDGFISLVKHNRPGRVMQMVVLLNDFPHAHALLDGKDGITSQFGSIHYYEDSDLPCWCPELSVVRTLGMRTFWDLQQNQQNHTDQQWQQQMLEAELRVCELEPYRSIAFFHHLILRKNTPS